MIISRISLLDFVLIIDLSWRQPILSPYITYHTLCHNVICYLFVMNLVKLAEQILLSSFFGVCFWCISSILVTTQHLSQICLLCDTRGDTTSFPHTCPSSPRNSLNCYLTPNFLQSFHRHHIWHCSSLAAFTQTSSQLFNAAREQTLRVRDQDT